MGPDALTDIDLAAILASFRVEAMENLASMEDGLLMLERAPDEEEAIAEVFRAAHTLKGNAMSVGSNDVAELAHVVEDVLDRVRAHDVTMSSGLVSFLLRAVDVLRETLAGASGEGTVLDVSATAQRTLRVEARKLDRTLDLVSELAVVRGRLERSIGELPPALAHAVLDPFEEIESRFADLQDEILKLRLVALGPALRTHARAVRDLAKSTGKLTRFAVDAGSVEVDTRVVELLRDPLVQMIRNAVDHGLELPHEREALGKSRLGQISIHARDAGGAIVLEVRDDGRGLSSERILARAKERGLVAADAAPSEREIFGMIFEPGLTTARSVSATSGRGVGMDIVKRNVEALRGTIEVESEPGRGTTIRLRFPLTVAIIEGFVVSVGRETFVLPLDRVVECLELPRNVERRATGVLPVRGNPLPYVTLRSLFELESRDTLRASAVVVRGASGDVALVVDGLHGERQTVIKPLGPLLGDARCVAGSAVMGTGEVALVLDVDRITEEVTSLAAIRVL